MIDARFQARSLEKLETEVNALLKEMAKADGLRDEPITDGVVDVSRYAVSSPKMLWILKEPWEIRENNEALGGWSLTQELLAKGRVDNKGAFAPMAYVTYSVFNNYLPWSEIPYVSKDAKVRESLLSIAYINVKKFPGKKRSYNPEIAEYYGKYKGVLLNQITGINPEIIIGGSTLHLFFSDLGLQKTMFRSAGSASFCIHDGRLYIAAYHPSQRTIGKAKYVDDITTVIKKNWNGRMFRAAT